MKLFLKAIVLHFLFWLLLFALFRLVFIIYYARLFNSVDFLSILSIFPHSIKLDISTICYFTSFSWLLWFIQSFYAANIINIFHKIFNLIIIILFSLIVSGEIGIYEEWKTKLTYKALLYIKNPDEIVRSAETYKLLLNFLILIILIVFGFWIYRKYFFVKISNLRLQWKASLLLLIFPVLLFIGIRGGIKQIPISQSQSFFSSHQIVNHVAVNSAWNLGQSILSNMDYMDKNPFALYPQTEALKNVTALYHVNHDTTDFILTTKRPNIFLVIMESWSADLIAALGGEKGISPNLEQIIDSGIVFSNTYSPGSRSQQGMASIFSGFPAHPIGEFTSQPDKQHDIPSLPKILRDNGYNTMFYFGGQLIYANIKSYIIYTQFEKIYDIYDFDRKLPRGKLGIHDEFVFNRIYNDLKKETSPFFLSFFTTSTHSPWDFPMKKKQFFNKDFNNYLNGAFYADSCIGEFLKKARHEDWYKNTLFIFIADHSHESYRQWGFYHPNSYRIPFILYGDVIKPEFRGKKFPKIASQNDLAKTLLMQMQLPANDFKYSKNLFNPYAPEFAYYAFEEGIGWVVPDKAFAYDVPKKYFYYKSNDTIEKEKIFIDGTSFLQVVYQEFLDK